MHSKAKSRHMMDEGGKKIVLSDRVNETPGSSHTFKTSKAVFSKPG